MPIMPPWNKVDRRVLANMTGYNTVKADALLVELAEDKPPFLLDVRSVEEVQENGHIEGATNIPLNELAQHIDLLPSFDTPIVAYCGSSWRATIAMTALHGMGWTNVCALKTPFADLVAAGYRIAEGLPEEMALNVAQSAVGLVTLIDPAMVAVKDVSWGVKAADVLNTELIEKPDIILIDVRTPEEVAESGVIAVEGQQLLNIPIESFMADKAMWPADKNAEIVIYCGSGHRSTMAMTILLTEGYTNVTSLIGRWLRWLGRGWFPGCGVCCSLSMHSPPGRSSKNAAHLKVSGVYFVINRIISFFSISKSLKSRKMPS